MKTHRRPDSRYQIALEISNLFHGEFDETNFTRQIFVILRFDEILEVDELKLLLDERVARRPVTPNGLRYDWNVRAEKK